MEQRNVLVKPVITEKSMDEAGRNRFTFVVSKESDKQNIKRAIEEQFKVNVVSVKTLIMKGKRRRIGRKRTEFHTAHYKKAVVELKEGQRIDLFEVAESKPAAEKS